MKMRENSGKKLKGSVLFTVIAVMMVIIVFVMSALTIAGATSRRAYSDYAKSQAQYTARSALDATLKYLRNGVYDAHGNLVNNDFANQVASLNKSSAPIELDINFSDAATGAADKAVAKDGAAKVTVKCLNDNYQYYDGSIHSVVMLTATVTLAGETSEESIVILKDPPSTPGKGGANAVTSLASFTAGTAPGILGGSSVNLLQDASVTSTSWYNANGIINGSAIVNSDLHIENLKEIVLNKGEGVTIYGDLTLGNRLNIKSIADLSNISAYKEIPYFFVDGAVYLNADKTVATIGGGGFSPMGPSSSGVGVNIYCKQLIFEKLNGGSHIYADVYTWERDTNLTNIDSLKDIGYYNETSAFVSKIGGNNTTKLLNWANKTLNPNANQLGGNFISNGSIKVVGEAMFKRDLIVSQGLYLLNGSSPVTIDGKLSVGEVLVVDSNNVSCNALSVGNIDNVIIKSGDLTVGNLKYSLTPEGKIKVNMIGAMGEKEYDSFKAAYEDGINGAITVMDAQTKADLYPNELTYAELVGLTEVFDAYGKAIPLNNDNDGDGIGDNKIADLPVNAYGKYLNKDKSTGNIVYEPNFFKTWKDTEVIDKNTGKKVKVEGMWRKFYTQETSGVPSVPVYDSSSYPDTISDSAFILKGGFIGGQKDIVIDTQGSDVWVYLDNLSIASAGPNIIVKGSGSVNFYSNTDINLSGNSCIATEKYKKEMDKPGMIKLDKNPVDFNDIPRIYIYMDYDTTGKRISLRNNVYITGYIFAPTATFDINASGKNKTVEYLCDGEKIITNRNLVLIGSAFVNDFSNGNEELLVYVSDSGLGTTPSSAYTEWGTISYLSGDGLGVE